MAFHRSFAEVAAVLFSVLVMVIALVMVSGAAAAQDGGNITQQPGEYVDQNTQLISAELDRDTDLATVQIESTAPQTIEIYDPAGYWTEGEPEHRTVRMDCGERVNVTLPLEGLHGSYAVVLDTQHTIHPERLREPTQDLGFLTVLTSGEAITTGAVSAFSWFVIAGVYVLWIEGGEPEVA